MNHLAEQLKELRLKYVEQGLPDLMEQARLHSLTSDAFLKRVLSLEIEGRKTTAQYKRLKTARLPMRKTLEEFDFSFQSSLNERHLWE
jgi:DNA replication protein DnaC